jgi:hypothetical protein
MTREERIAAIKKIRQYEEEKRILDEYWEQFNNLRNSRPNEKEESYDLEDDRVHAEMAHQEEMENLEHYLESKRDEMEARGNYLESREGEIEALHYQLSEPEDPLQEAGRRLVDHAESIGTTARGLVTDLFPYIYAASKRMSTRAISSFLQKDHNVQISPATIARALRDPQKHVEVFAETVEPHARILAEVHGVDILALLKDEKGFFKLTVKNRELLANNSDEQIALSLQYEEARSFIVRTWFTVAPELRAMTYKVIEEQLKEEASEPKGE